MKKGFVFLAALIVIIVSSISLVLFSSTGLNLVLRVVSPLTDGAVTIEGSGGTIARGWWISGLKIRSDGADISAQEVRLDWQLSRVLEGNVHVSSISIKEIEIIIKESGQEVTEPASSPFELPIIAIPLTIMVDKLTVDGGIVRHVSAPEPLFVMDQLSLQIRASADQLIVDELAVKSPELETTLNGKLRFSKDWPLEVQGKWMLDLADYSPVSGTVILSGTVNNPGFVVSVSDPLEVTLNGKLNDIFDELSWQANGEVVKFNPRDISPDWPLLVVDATVESAGSIDDYSGRIRALIQAGDYPQPAVDLVFSGNQSSLAIEPATLSVSDNETTLTGMVDWQNDFSWNLLAQTTDFELSVLDPRLAGLVSLSASTEGRYDDNLQYRLEISDFVGVFEALNQDVIGGLIVDGNESGLKVLSSDFTLGEGKVDIVGQVNWQDAISWDTRILLHSFDPSAIEATLEGSINAEANSHGIVSGSSVNGGIELERVSGSLAGYQLSGGGTIDYLDGNIKIKDLFLENGRNHLAVDGTIAQTLDLTFSLDGHELNRVVPVLGGTVSARGKVAGTRAYPDLAVMINGDSLSYGDYSVGTIASDITFSGERDGKIEATIKGEAINVSGHLVHQATAELTGSMEDHHLAVSIDSDQGALQLSTDGVLSDRKIWQGQIKNLQLKHPRFGVWQNDGVSSVRLSEQSADIKDLCITSEDIEFCSEGSWEGPAAWSFDTRKLMVDLALLNNWSIMEPAASGVIQGSISGSGDGTHLSSLAADFALDEMALGIKKNEYYEELKWFDTKVSVKLENTLLKTELYSRFVDDSFITATLGLSEIDDLSAPFNDLSLEGNLQTVINDMNPLKVLTGGYLEPKGKLSADLALSGTIGDPRVTGDVNLVDGEIRIPQLNITPKNINASINGRGESIIVTLEAVSGEGRVAADGEFNFENKSWLGTVKIVGSNVELIKQKEVEMTADSDLLLTLGPDGGRLEGTLVIPKALIQPEEMTGSESESDDVVMMGEVADKGSWPFNLAVKIDLGDNVKVDGYGLSGNLRGSLNLANTKSDFLAGRGELYLDNGLFSIYDRELQITRSKVLFGGGPVDNPGLDVSARKTIKAEKLEQEDIVVGVNIIGSVDDFEMELFSIPSMDDSDIIAYIVVGTSMSASSDSEGGALGAALNVISKNQGNKILGDIGGAFAVDDLKLEGSGSDDRSLVVGKRLMDDLYISYDFNLYKNSGYFRIRYDFGRGFSVEGINSMESNGVNLLYSFEN